MLFRSALEAGSGYLISGSIIPRDGRAFTVSVALDPVRPLNASGAILTLYDVESASVLLRLGVAGGLPYLEAGDSMVHSTTRLPSGLSHLVLEIVPAGADAAEAKVSLFLNNERVGSGIIPGRLFRFTGPVTTFIGGPGGLEAVYDELVVLEGRYQAFLVARAYEFGSNLVEIGRAHV